MRVYCKNCKHFPRLNFWGKRLAKCKAYQGLEFYSPEYDGPSKCYEFCSTQNSDHDCPYYKEK